MEDRSDAGTTELSDLISIWANAWAKEKGARGIAWVEHTKAAAEARLKWKMGGYTKAQQHGLTLVISAVADVVSETAEMSPPHDPITLLCEPGKSIATEARRLQEQHFADVSCKIALSGNVVLFCSEKVDPKLDTRPGAHNKWVIGIQTVMADLQRFAALDDEKIISTHDKDRIQGAMNGYTIDAEIVSCVLPPFERLLSPTQEVTEGEEKTSELSAVNVPSVTPPPQNAGFLARFGFKGTQGKGVPVNTQSQTVPPVIESTTTLGMGSNGGGTA